MVHTKSQQYTIYKSNSKFYFLITKLSVQAYKKYLPSTRYSFCENPKDLNQFIFINANVLDVKYQIKPIKML